MPDAGTVNAQITDALSQSSTITIGSSPSVALGFVYQAVAQAMGNAANNATLQQQQGGLVTIAVASTGSAIILAEKPTK